MALAQAAHHRDNPLQGGVDVRIGRPSPQAEADGCSGTIRDGSDALKHVGRGSAA